MSNSTYLAWVISINFSCLFIVLFVLFGDFGEIEPINGKQLVQDAKNLILGLPTPFYYLLMGMVGLWIGLKIFYWVSDWRTPDQEKHSGIEVTDQ